MQDYVASNSSTPYYFGHFLFEEKGENEYAIIDGQQRLTTTVIFLSALYAQLKKIKHVGAVEDLGDDLRTTYYSTIKEGSRYRFSTVDYDNQFFRDYVIDQTRKNKEDDTQSKVRIAAAFDYFTDRLAKIEEKELVALLEAITHASCTTHVIKDAAEAVQIFMFQNNRGKKPTSLEIIKAQFMRHVHLHAPSGEITNILDEITRRFEGIYKSIAQTEHRLDEDSILNYTIKVRRNNLNDITSTVYVDGELRKADGIEFVREFTQQLESCFALVTKFLKQEKENMAYHALLVSADNSIMFPFVIKAMRSNMEQDELNKLAGALEQIFLRHHIIGTRASLISRLNWCYEKMESNATEVVGHIEWMKKQNDWWGYWNDDELKRCLNTWMYHSAAKIVLWKYENHLRASGKSGYNPIRYDSIETPHLEHIAPLTENTEENNGYCPYDEEFKKQYLDCLGNYLLLSGSHNESLSNGKFQEKRKSYKHLLQQIEIQEMTEQDQLWDKEKIRQRHEKLVEVFMQIL